MARKKKEEIVEDVINDLEAGVEDVKENTETDQEAQPTIEAIELEDLVKGQLRNAVENLGQSVWLTKEDVYDKDGEVVNTADKVNIIRTLTDGSNQLLSITIAEEKQLIFK